MEKRKETCITGNVLIIRRQKEQNNKKRTDNTIEKWPKVLNKQSTNMKGA